MTMPIREPERSVTGAPLSPGRRWARMIRTRYPGDMTPRPTKVPCVNTAALGFVAMTPNPTVRTFSPACRSSRYREAAYPRVRPLTDSRARSSRALAATRLASWSPPSSVHTDRPGHPVTTWRLVTRKPAGETKKPVPLFTRPAAEPGDIVRRISGRGARHHHHAGGQDPCDPARRPAPGDPGAPPGRKVQPRQIPSAPLQALPEPLIRGFPSLANVNSS